MKHLIQILTTTRKKRKLSQAQLGKKLGLPQSHVSKIESGDVDIRLSSFLDFVRILGLEVVLLPKGSGLALEQSLSTQESPQRSMPELLLMEDAEDTNE